MLRLGLLLLCCVIDIALMFLLGIFMLIYSADIPWWLDVSLVCWLMVNLVIVFDPFRQS